LQGILGEDVFFLVSECQNFGSDPVSVRTVGTVADELDLQGLDFLIDGSGLFE